MCLHARACACACVCVCVLLMGECGSLRLKILFWMSEHLYFLHLSSLSNLISLCSVFIIHMSLVRSVMSGSAAQVQLGWDCNFPSPGKYLMLFAVICMSEHTFITLWFFFQIINISGVCILRKTLFCGKVLCNTSHLDSEKTSQERSGSHMEIHERSRILKAQNIWSWSDCIKRSSLYAWLCGFV